MGKTFKATVDWLGMVENGGSLPGQDEDPSVNGGKAQTGEEIIQGGMLPEVEVSALTDKTYNTLSGPQKQVYDSFVTPGGIAQTVNIWEDNYGNTREMHWKNALQMTEDLGIRNIYNTPSWQSKLWGMDHLKNPQFQDDFRAHASPWLKNVYIPRHVGPYNPDYTDPYGSQKELDVPHDQWGSIDDEDERQEITKEMEDVARSEYFNSLIAEFAHIPEFWRLDSFKNLPVTFAKRIYRTIIEMGFPDRSNYKDPHDIEYKTHTGPDSFEEQLRSKYELKEGGGKAQIGTELSMCSNGEWNGGSVKTACGNRNSAHNLYGSTGITIGDISDKSLSGSLRGGLGYSTHVPYSPMTGHVGLSAGTRFTGDEESMMFNPTFDATGSVGIEGEFGGNSHNWREPWKYGAGIYGKQDLVNGTGTTAGLYGNVGNFSGKVGYNTNTGAEATIGFGLPIRQEGGERERFINFLKDNEGGAEYIRNKNSVTKKIVDDEEWDGESYHKIFDEDSQKHYAHIVGDEKAGTIGYGHHNKDVLKNFPNGITETKALEMLGEDADAALSNTEIWWNSKYKSGDWEKLDESTQYMLADIGYNVGHIREFPKFANAINTGDFELAEAQYKRYDNNIELGRNVPFMEEYLKPWMDVQKEKIAVAPSFDDMPLPIGVNPIDGTLDTSDPFEKLDDLEESKYGGQHNWALDRRPISNAQRGKEIKSDDVYSNDRYSSNASKYKTMLPKYQSEGAWNDFEESSVGKFVNAKGLRQDGEHFMNTVGDYFGYDEDEGKDLALDATAIINPAADFIHAGTKFDEGEYTDAALYAGFGILPFTAGPLVKGVKNKIINPIKDAVERVSAKRFGLWNNAGQSTTHTYNPKTKSWIENNAPKVQEKLLKNDIEYLAKQDYITNKITKLQQGKIKITEEIKQFKEMTHPNTPGYNERMKYLLKTDNVINGQLDSYSDILNNVPPTYTDLKQGDGSFGLDFDMDKPKWIGPTMKSGNDDIMKGLNAELKKAEKFDLDRIMGDYKWDNRNILSKYFDTPKHPFNADPDALKPFWLNYKDGGSLPKAQNGDETSTSYGQKLADSGTDLVEKGFNSTRPSMGVYENITEFFGGTDCHKDRTCVQAVRDIYENVGFESGIPQEIYDNESFSKNYKDYGYELVPTSDRQPGDLLQYYYKNGAVDRKFHMGIYVGDNNYVGDGTPNDPMSINNIYEYSDGTTKEPFNVYRKTELPNKQKGGEK